MTIDFKPRGTSSFDQQSGVHIPLPRMLPHTFADGLEGVEYQFSFRRGDERIDGLGVFGTEQVVETSGQLERVYAIDLSSASALKSMLRSKESFAATDDDLIFLRGLARGLVDVIASQHGDGERLSCVAYTGAEALSSLGIPVPVSADALEQGVIVLAEASVPAHRG
ncbi:MAG: hypothetical protein ACREPD_16370 [Stenotrophomonas sp.]|uniref:hypothetical protein n=1 Tax=Gammaproteobacteria TaxID=1236 RepID=UPI003D6D8507